MVLYHGSITPNIEQLEPRRRYTPGQLGDDVPAAVYATDDPAYAAAHAFPWGSDEGFDLRYIDGMLHFEVPAQFRDRLKVPAYLYELPADNFTVIDGVRPLGRNYWATVPVKPTGRIDYQTVEEGVTKNGGVVDYV